MIYGGAFGGILVFCFCILFIVEYTTFELMCVGTYDKFNNQNANSKKKKWSSCFYLVFKTFAL